MAADYPAGRVTTGRGNPADPHDRVATLTPLSVPPPISLLHPAGSHTPHSTTAGSKHPSPSGESPVRRVGIFIPSDLTSCDRA